MSDATLSLGPITKRVAAPVRQFRLVALDAAGKAVHAQADSNVFGAITMNRDPADPRSRDLVAVHYTPAAIMLEVAGGDATSIKSGAYVYAAADGFAAATGTDGKHVGVALEDGVGGRVLTLLNNVPQGA